MPDNPVFWGSFFEGQSNPPVEESSPFEEKEDVVASVNSSFTMLSNEKDDDEESFPAEWDAARQTIVEMGFSDESARVALIESKGELVFALQTLLDQQNL
jgi:hypothetical protein